MVQWAYGQRKWAKTICDLQICIYIWGSAAWMSTAELFLVGFQRSFLWLTSVSRWKPYCQVSFLLSFNQFPLDRACWSAQTIVAVCAVSKLSLWSSEYLPELAEVVLPLLSVIQWKEGGREEETMLNALQCGFALKYRMMWEKNKMNIFIERWATKRWKQNNDNIVVALVSEPWIQHNLYLSLLLITYASSNEVCEREGAKNAPEEKKQNRKFRHKPMSEVVHDIWGLLGRKHWMRPDLGTRRAPVDVNL